MATGCQYNARPLDDCAESEQTRRIQRSSPDHAFGVMRTSIATSARSTNTLRPIVLAFRRHACVRVAFSKRSKTPLRIKKGTERVELGFTKMRGTVSDRSPRPLLASPRQCPQPQLRTDPLRQSRFLLAAEPPAHTTTVCIAAVACLVRGRTNTSQIIQRHRKMRTTTVMDSNSERGGRNGWTGSHLVDAQRQDCMHYPVTSICCALCDGDYCKANRQD